MRIPRTDEDKAKSQFVRELDGLSFVLVSEIVSRPSKPSQKKASPLMREIQKQWPNSMSQVKIERRYRECYAGLPERDAILAVSKGYSSPNHAMRAGIIKKRRYVGFDGDGSS